MPPEDIVNYTRDKNAHKQVHFDRKKKRIGGIFV